jgi:uncharacterized Zn-finger protein
MAGKSHEEAAMSKTVLLIPIEDLKELEITCPNPDCKHPFVIRLLDRPAKGYPSHCPYCSTLFVQAEPNALDQMMYYYNEVCSGLKKANLKPQFRYTVEKP